MKKKKLIIGFSIYFGVLILIYLGMTLYFQDRFLPGSVINNVDYSSKTVAEVESDIANEMQDYSLTLIERGNVKEVITGSEINFSYSSDGSVEQIKDEQRPFYGFRHTLCRIHMRCSQMGFLMRHC